MGKKKQTKVVQIGDKVQLNHPCRLDNGSELKELVVKVDQLTVGDEITARKGTGGDEAMVEVNLAAKVFGINPEDMSCVDRRDWSEVQEVLSRFLY